MKNCVANVREMLIARGDISAPDKLAVGARVGLRKPGRTTSQTNAILERRRELQGRKGI